MQHAGHNLTLFFNVHDVPPDSAASLSDRLSSGPTLQRLQRFLAGGQSSVGVIRFAAWP
jgi:hypothetical protein